MKRVKLAEVLKKAAVRKKVVEGMRIGDIFVYPTDTVYGIGCNAEIPGQVKRIAEAKGRKDDRQFSVIAPGKAWIWEHSGISKAAMELADNLLPGPYTIVLKAKENSPPAVVSREKSMGVRLPKHPVTELIAEAGVPFVSTSVNMSGESPLTDPRDIPDGIKEVTDWLIDEGKTGGRPSRVFDLRGREVRILRH